VSIRTLTVLISGNGSNLQALIDAGREGRLPVDIAQVISNRAEAFGLQRARQAGIHTAVLQHGDFSSRGDYDRALANLIADATPDLVILAGFMRILGPEVLRRFGGRMINLHPSLLPLYRGTDTYARAIRAGDTEHGASMHFVTSDLDAGPLISQVRIPISGDDDAASLAARLSPREHQLVVATVALFCHHSVECVRDEVRVDGKALARPMQLQDDGHLAP
jgi:phosphoribosylglycinamide formyltransferase-1